MSNYSPELIQTMRAALDEVMATIPANQATPEVKAYMAEIILKAAARGQTHHEGLFAAAAEEIQRVLSQLALLRPSRPQTVAHERSLIFEGPRHMGLLAGNVSRQS